jgi:glycosyltransferase involved in cell wall biosynthesis
MGVRNLNKDLDTTKSKLEVKSYCPQDISKVYSSEGALSRDFLIANLTSPEKIHVHLRAYVDFYGGYSEHGRNVLFKLQESGRCEVKLTPIKSLIDIDPPTMQRCSWFVSNPGFVRDGSIYLCIAGPGWGQDKFNPKDGRYKILWTMIESLDCHPRITEWLVPINEVWLPTQADMRRFHKVVHPLQTKRIMPLGYDHKLYNPQVEEMRIANLENRYVFGVLGSWNKRKGVREIVQAFCTAFTPKDNVSLLLVSKYATRPYDGIKYDEEVTKEDIEKWDLNYELKRYLEPWKNPPHIALIDIPIHENVLPHIMKRFNCLVGFSMGESTWLPGLQAMAMKIPVIQLASDCSGFMDYMDDENSYLCRRVNYVEADDELVKGTSEYYEGQKFAQGSSEELVNTMRRVYEERRNRVQKEKLTNALYSVSDRTWDKQIKKVVERLEEIHGAKNIS